MRSAVADTPGAILGGMSDQESQGIDTKLAAIRASRARLRAERDAEQAAKADEDELKREQRALKDESAIFDAERKIGKQGEKIFVVKDVNHPDFDVVVVKRPNAVAFKQFQDLEAPKTIDIEKLVAPCVVYPSIDAFDKAQATEIPGLLLRAAKGVSYLAGVRKADEQGKA